MFIIFSSLYLLYMYWVVFSYNYHNYLIINAISKHIMAFDIYSIYHMYTSLA